MPKPSEDKGNPEDVVQARRRVGYGTATLQMTEFPQPGLGPCDCHPLSEANGWAYTIHEGDVLTMRRREVVGYVAEDGTWNAGRADFDLVEDEPKGKKAAQPPAEVSGAESHD